MAPSRDIRHINAQWNDEFDETPDFVTPAEIGLVFDRCSLISGLAYRNLEVLRGRSDCHIWSYAYVPIVNRKIRAAGIGI